MPEAGELSILELALAEACGGSAAGLGLGLAAREDFALPGDKRVYGRDRALKIDHIRLELDFNYRQRSLAGSATITFEPRSEALREAVLDAYELDVESVTDDGGKALPFVNTGRELRIDLGRARPAGRPVTVAVRYSTKPRRGVYFNVPDDGLSRTAPSRSGRRASPRTRRTGSPASTTPARSSRARSSPPYRWAGSPCRTVGSSRGRTTDGAAARCSTGRRTCRTPPTS